MRVRKIPFFFLGFRCPELCLSQEGEVLRAGQPELLKSLQIPSKNLRFMALSETEKFLMRCMSSDLINCSIKCKHGLEKRLLETQL